ncbi:heparinase II/III family protein [Rhodovulum sp. DZ06]|uniref:heparinase II/III family protein n=1 Tax=Rhodovulum sp. DZ06 TaxID=3425126 RepID=UPI003D338D29
MSDLFSGFQIKLAGFGGAPTALVGRPAPIWMGESARGRAMMRGVYRLAGQELQAPGFGPWKLRAPSAAFSDALHGFDWLGDFALLAGSEPKRVARSWIYGWIATHGERGEGEGWRPGLAGRRLIAWSAHAGLALNDADPELAKRFYRAVGQHARYLAGHWKKAPEGRPRICALAGLVWASLAFDRFASEVARNAQALGIAADRMTAADGGIPSRNPEELSEVHLVLAAAAEALGAAGHAVPDDLKAALDRMAPALRLLRFGDGRLARFHGGGAGPEGRLDHALALARAPRTAPARAAMGFRRMHAGRSAVVMDVAAPPATPEAHASTLALELSSGPRRILVSAGPGRAFGAEWADACRATAAHSALTVARTSSARIASRAKGPGPHPFSEGPATVTAEEASDGEGEWLLARHDGFLSTHGLIHARRLFLSLDGRDFRGEDTVESPDARAQKLVDRAVKALGDHGERGLPFAARFHLHPEVQVAQDGGDFTLFAGAERWRFSCTGGRAGLEDAVYFASGAPEPLATKQIVVSARTEGYWGRVTWAFRREG